MNIATLVRSIFSVSAAAGLLAGCSGSPLGQAAGVVSGNAGMGTNGLRPNFAVTRVGTVDQHPNHARSFIQSGKVAKSLLYISDPGNDDVEIFSYPKGQLVGTLTGFSYPQGICSDPSGNVYVADTGTAQIYKFAHGATSPSAVLSDPNETPASCAVDPNSGNLAVSNLLSATNFEVGSISVYPSGSTTPTVYTDPDNAREYFLAYDSSGNIWVDGVDSKANTFRFAEMSPTGTFTEIKVKGMKITFPGGVQVAGSYIAVGDQDGAVTGTPDVYRVTAAGKLVGKSTLATSNGGRLGDLVEYTLAPVGAANPSQIIAPDAIGATVYLNKWTSGAYGSSIAQGLLNPLGTALSIVK
jgi:hypothetical protein